MPKHVIDRSHQLTDTRLARYLRIARQPAWSQLSNRLGRRMHRQPVSRMSAYLRIARQAG